MWWESRDLTPSSVVWPDVTWLLPSWLQADFDSFISKTPADGVRLRMQFPGIGDSPSKRFRNTEASPELDAKTKKVVDKFGEALEAVANEPSLALFRIQEHVRKSLPPLMARRLETRRLHRRVEGLTYDIDYAAKAVTTMRKSDLHFQNIQDLLKNSMFMTQQLEYQAEKRKNQQTNSSMYSRPQLRMSRPYSVHDLPFGSAVGVSPSETASATGDINTIKEEPEVVQIRGMQGSPSLGGSKRKSSPALSLSSRGAGPKR